MQWCSGGVCGGVASPKYLGRGWHSPNEQVSRVDAVAVASPQIKLDGHQTYSQMNQHDFGGCLVVHVLHAVVSFSFFLQQLLNKKPGSFIC
jgi:hypothetical protein